MNAAPTERRFLFAMHAEKFPRIFFSRSMRSHLEAESAKEMQFAFIEWPSEASPRCRGASSILDAT